MKLTYQPRRADINFCWKVSNFRYDINKDLGWAHSHKNWALIVGFIGALGELAASKMFGIEWGNAMLPTDKYLVCRKTEADLGPFEIKTVHKEVGALKIGKNDKDFARALLMLAPNSYDAGVELVAGKSPMIPPIKLVGYMDVSEVKKVGTWHPEPQDSKKGKWVVLRKNLKDPNELSKFLEHFDQKRKTKNLWIKSGKVPPFRLTP
jgi:hypothetical protein